MWLPSQSRWVRVRWCFPPPDTPFVPGEYLYSSSNWDLDTDYFPGYGEDGADSREYANGTCVSSLMVHGQGGGEGDGEAYAAGSEFCTVVAWTLTLAGFSGPCSVANGDYLLSLAFPCEWNFITTVPEGTLTIALAHGDIDGVDTAQLEIQWDADSDLQTLLFYLPVADFATSPGSTTTMPLSFEFGTCAVGVLTDIDVTVATGVLLVQGEGGGEGNGETGLTPNFMDGNAGVEINGEAEVDLS